MAALIDAGEKIEAVATPFGVGKRHVKQRLRLGKVASELLDEFRAAKLTPGVMTAFTLGADHAAQIVVWRQVNEPYIQLHMVRLLLTQARSLSTPASASLSAPLPMRPPAARSIRRRR